MEQRPKQHGGVTVGKHKPIAVGPDRILGIELHYAIPQGVHQRRESHRRARVSGVGRLHRIDRKRADGVDTLLIQLHASQRFSDMRDTHVSLLAALGKRLSRAGAGAVRLD